MYINAAINPAEIVNQLFPNLWIFIAHLIATIVLLFLLTKWVYNPFRKSMRERRNFIKEKINDAVFKQAKANKNQAISLQKINDAKEEANQIIMMAKKEASDQKLDILNEAKQEAKIISENSKKSILEDREKANEDIKNKISEISILAAAKILNKEIDHKTHEELVKKSIEELMK